MSSVDPTVRVRPPDVVVVVLDTARLDVLSGGLAAAPGQTFLDELRAQCWVHPRTIAPAPWTAPSHASLFTGLPPWEHRLHLKGLPKLAPGSTTLADSLRAIGYRTASFTTNNFVGPLTGLHQGFEDWWVGGKQDWLLRGFRGPPTEASTRRSGSNLARIATFGLQEPVWSWIARWPRPVDKIAPLLNGRKRGPAGMRVAPWIEGELRRWLASIPAERPAFAFVNFMEPHEPYFGILPTPGDGPGRAGPWTGAVRQDSSNWAIGSWSPTDEELASMRRAYDETFRTLDDRLRDLVQLLRAAGRWENSLFVLTSDHGQAFGEAGVLFHGLRTAESLLRVPLWIRPPHGVDVPLPLEDWISLAVLRPAIEAMVAQVSGDVRGDPRAAPGGNGRVAAPVVAIADGLGGIVRSRVPARRLAELDRLEVCGYLGSRKLTMDVATEHCSRVDLDSDPKGEHPQEVVPSGELDEVFQALRSAARLAFPDASGAGATVDSRLASWGYV